MFCWFRVYVLIDVLLCVLQLRFRGKLSVSCSLLYGGNFFQLLRVGDGVSFLQVVLCIRKDVYRKPSAAVWQTLVKEWHGGLHVDIGRCFFVGDAAGRVGDHSADDRGFAAAAGLQFYTQDEFFLQNKGPM